MVRQVKIVSGLNWGDEGKGLVTNFFSSDSSVVVLSSNSSQRGHTVIHNGIRHVFRHFGSGTLKGAVTYFTGDFLVNPAMFREEYEVLMSFGIKPVVYCRSSSLIVTPYDMLANQIIEDMRGTNRFSSCGCGAWETRVRNKFGKLKDKITNFDVELVENYYKNLRLANSGMMQSFCTDMARYNFENDIKFFTDRVKFIENDFEEKAFLNKFNNIIFENSQGLLLDTDYNNDLDHTTPAHVGAKYPSKIIEKTFDVNNTSIENLYVTRSYFTRHGIGALGHGGECAKSNINEFMTDVTNMPNPWQGSLRYGHILDSDIVDMLKRMTIDTKHLVSIGYNIKPSIVITHLNEYNNTQLLSAIKQSKNTLVNNVYSSVDEVNIRKV